MVDEGHAPATIADYLNANLELLGIEGGHKFGEAGLREYMQSVGLIGRRAPRTPKTPG